MNNQKPIITVKRKILIGILVIAILFGGWWIWKSQIPPILPSFESLKACENDFDCQCCEVFGVIEQHSLTVYNKEAHSHVCINKNYLDKGLDKSIDCYCGHSIEEDERTFCGTHQCKCKNNECTAEFMIKEK